ncbi:hypothetical protein C0J52_27791 [Blattella germanica]|nr:hypothetical protein C0J52_27791 [Blattella germanica]
MLRDIRNFTAGIVSRNITHPCRSEANKEVMKNDDFQIFGILKNREMAIVKLENKCRKLSMSGEKLEGKIKKLQDGNALHKELLQVKDKAIVDLTNQIHDLRTGGVDTREMAVQTERIAKDIYDTLDAFLSQNKFLNEELIETSQLLLQSAQREEKLLVEASDWEAQFYQTQSKYMLILNELQNPEFKHSSEEFQELIARLMGDSVSDVAPSLR